MGPIRVPLRLAASAIIQRQHAPPLAGERRREAREIVGGTRQAGKTNDRAPASRRDSRGSEGAGRRRR